MQAYSDNRIFGLDLLRAIAIVLVIFSSIYFIVPDIEGVIGQLMRIAGVLGVEVFLVLSGFLTGRLFCKLYIKEDFRFKTVIEFWKQRWIRVLPNYAFGVIASILVSIFIGQNLPDDLWTYALLLQNFTSTNSTGFFYESWSVTIGEYAALLGPLSLYIALCFKTKISKSKLFLFITLLIIGVFLASKFLYSTGDNTKSMLVWSASLKTVVIYRIDAVYYGVLAAYISIVKPKLWQQMRYFGSVLSLLVLFGLHVLASKNYWFIETHPTYWNVWYLPLNSIAIALLIPYLSQWRSVSKFIDKPIRFLSSIAYAVYIIHYSVVLRMLTHNLPIKDLPKFDSIVYILMYTALLLLFGYILNTYFEKPFRTLLGSSKLSSYSK